MTRQNESDEMLQAIAAGEVDAFVIADKATKQRHVYTLSTADRPYRMFVENMRDGAATVSPGGLILFANRRLAELLGRRRETIIGSPLSNFMSDLRVSALAPAIGIGGEGTTIEFDLVSSKGLIVPVLVGMTSLEENDVRLVCLTFTDQRNQKAQDLKIAQLNRDQAVQVLNLQDAQSALQVQATHDALTGLPNRGLLLDRIDQALSHSRRFGLCIAVFFIDLDRFKHINDNHGHGAGDVVLRRVAAQMTSLVRPMDTVARIGGDEFVVLAPDVDSVVHAVDIGTRLANELRLKPNAAEGERVSVSVGISVSMGGRGTSEVMLDEADTAMYQAKSRGGGRAEVFDEELGLQIQQRSTAQRHLQSALDDRRLVAYYQPVVELDHGNVVGFEALARIVDRDGSIVPPAAFIKAAEDNGLVVPLGSMMLGMACEEAHRWQQAGLGVVAPTVAVNLSARQFESGDLLMLVNQILTQSDLDPTCLHFELTETAIIDLRPDILQQLGAIRDLGIQVGLDDFGTGYASLTHLRRLPLTFVKIDQTFVQGIETDKEDDRIVSAVVDLAANLGLRSIAEGVETQAQLDRLRQLGCDQAQGYLFARPTPSAGVADIYEVTSW